MLAEQWKSDDALTNTVVTRFNFLLFLAFLSSTIIALVSALVSVITRISLIEIINHETVKTSFLFATVPRRMIRKDNLGCLEV